MPDSASEHSKLTVTGPLLQPKPLAAGVRCPSMLGAMPSILIVIEWPGAARSSTLPARSRLQKEMVCSPFAPKSNASA